MAVNDDIESRYTEHGLQLIRFANGLAGSSTVQLQALAAKLRRQLRQYDENLSPREMRELLAAVQETIATAYSAISYSQLTTLRDLLDVEVDFAMRATGLTTALGERTTSRVAAGITVHGAPIKDHWVKQCDNLTFGVQSALRAAHSTGATRQALFANVLGTGRVGQERGGLLERAQVTAKGLVDSSVQSTTNAGRLASFRANDSEVNALSWFGILDGKVCANCAMRAGKLYTVDFKPIGHAIPIVGTPPLHPFCRCMLLPMKFPKGLPADGGPTTKSFEIWLKKRSAEDQERLLGVGRTALWKSGKITLQQLIGQNGLVTTLGALKRDVASR